MSIECVPVGNACNQKCTYCYEDPMREAGNINVPIDMQKMLKALRAKKYKFSLHGGEPLLLSLDKLEEVFKLGLEMHGRNDIQTNGTLITEEHFRLFKKYKVGVGISIDGPAELNDTRWMGTLEKTREASLHTEKVLYELIQRKMHPSIIFTLYRGNAVGERLHMLLDWFSELDEMGLRHARMHLLEVDSEKARELALTDNEAVGAILDFQRVQNGFKNLRFDIFKELQNLLLGDDEQTSCIWHACDPYTTRAVQGVDGQGNSTNCGRTNKDGVSFTKSATPGFERQLILAGTPQQDGGCQDCRFFFACKGHCPGTAIDGDWRNRTEHCGVWYRLFVHTERGLLEAGREPLSISSHLNELHETMLSAWSRGANISIARAVKVLNGQARLPTAAESEQDHSDHWDLPDGDYHSDGPYEAHGDAGITECHGDGHGDSGHADE